MPALVSERRRSIRAFAVIALAIALLPGYVTQASIYAQQMRLEGLCAKADRILRATVMDITRGEIKAGGGTLPTITYRLKIKDTVAGRAAENLSFTMIADPKSPVQSGTARRMPLMELPQLESGKEYLLFTTKPSKIGLSSPVGLVQGCFTITSKGSKEFAVNGANNVGLGLPKPGPIDYQELVARIRALRPN